jgi:hypothetical protein
VPAVIAAVAGLGAGWIAAGSTGLLTHPLRHSLIWLACGLAVVAVWPRSGHWTKWLTMAMGAALALALAVPLMPVSGVLAVALMLALLTRVMSGSDRRLLGLVSLSVALLAIYRMAYVAIPSVWLAANGVGQGLGRLAGRCFDKPLWIGATFAGVDYLLVMGVVYAGWLSATSRPRAGRAVYGAAAVLLGHLAYLFLLAWSIDLRDALPEPPAPPATDLYVPTDWSWTGALKTTLPWHVPCAGAVIQLAIAAMMFRWARWKPAVEHESRLFAVPKKPLEALAVFGPLALAILIPTLNWLSPQKVNLEGKRVVAYDEGYLNWLKPEHDNYGRESAGLYGMLPTFVESLGAEFAHSADLSPEDLGQADILVLIHPDQPWSKEGLDRVWQFVRDGGAVLLVAEPHVYDGEYASSFNQFLEPTSMRVRFDVAVAGAAFWQHSHEPVAHPAVIGIGHQRDRFGMGEASSIDIRWPARPILVGRWGWSDPGSDAVLTEVFRLEEGEKLGDLVLAAEQRVGRGTVAVLADATGIKNEGISQAYPFVGRLLGHLANPAGNPQVGWRQVLAVVASLMLAVLLAWQPDPRRLAAVAVLMAVAMIGCQTLTGARARILPDGRRHKAYNNVAYIDDAHLGTFSDMAWAYDGIVSLKLNLMRNGYLPLMAPDLRDDRLERADLLVSVGPARHYSGAERSAVARFVHGGGTLISTVGGGWANASSELLADFQLEVPRSPVGPGQKRREPKPLGSFQTPYLYVGEDQPHVLFYAAWPLEAPPEPWEEHLLQLLVERPDLVAEARAKIIPRDLVYGPYRTIYRKMFEFTESGTSPTVDRVVGSLEDTRTKNVLRKLASPSRGGFLSNPADAPDGEERLRTIFDGYRKRKLRVLVTWFDDAAVVLVRLVGEGTVVLIGDTEFAVNKNLAYVPQEYFNGPYNNAHFWRWLLTDLRGPEGWLPPAPEQKEGPPASGPPPTDGEAQPDPSDRTANEPESGPIPSEGGPEPLPSGGPSGVDGEEGR